jgi:hypothetical protein
MPYDFGAQEDYAGLQRLRRELDAALLRKRQAGSQLSENKKKYEVAKADLTMRLKAEGMPATLIRDLVRGDDDVADLRFLRDVAQVNYDTEQEVINAIKVNIRVVADQIAREWAAVPIMQG